MRDRRVCRIKSPALALLPVLGLLGSCQEHTIGVVLNSSKEEIFLSYTNNRVPREGGEAVCASDRADPLVSNESLRGSRDVRSDRGNWTVDATYRYDSTSCGVNGVRIRPGGAVLVAMNPQCDDFEETVRKRGVELSRYTAFFNELSAVGPHGRLLLKGWDATARFKRTRDDVCVLEIVAADLKN